MSGIAADLAGEVDACLDIRAEQRVPDVRSFGLLAGRLADPI